MRKANNYNNLWVLQVTTLPRQGGVHPQTNFIKKRSPAKLCKIFGWLIILLLNDNGGCVWQKKKMRITIR